MDAYCWPQSARATESIDVMVSAAEPQCRVQIVRIGAAEEVVAEFELSSLGRQRVPDGVGANGCGWTPSFTVELDPAWKSGFYLVRLTADAATAEAFFVVKATNPGDSLLVLSTTTWAAYNDWQAPSFYTGGHLSSMKRPLPPGFLSKDQPRRFRAANAIHVDREERRDHFAQYSVWSVAAGFANWEKLFVIWAETEGIEFDYATSHDLATDAELLNPYKLYLSVGHDEYWTASMRDSVETWVDNGGAALFFSGNTSFWQIRLEDDDARVVGYKFDPDSDPVVGTELEHTVSTMWSDPLCRRPENEMTGVSFTRGGYASMHNSPPGGGYTIHRPDHWVFAGLDLRRGDVVGDDPFVVGYECDGCEMRWIDGLPEPTGAGGTPLNFEILGTAPAKLWETSEVYGGLADNYVGELNWVAQRLLGEDNAENRDYLEQGAAAMGTFERGAGWVFTTGCTDWAYGLSDSQIAQITRNLIARALA